MGPILEKSMKKRVICPGGEKTEKSTAMQTKITRHVLPGAINTSSLSERANQSKGNSEIKTPISCVYVCLCAHSGEGTCLCVQM